MKLITRIRINRALRYYRKRLKEEQRLVNKYGVSSTLASFYEGMINEYESAKDYLKSKGTLV